MIPNTIEKTPAGGLPAANCSLFLGDCLEMMKHIPDGSVDMVMCDLPYGTTACKWDSVIPFEPLWEAYRPDGPAAEWANGDREWYVNGEFHRVGGPAIERANGYRAWLQNDKYHRKRGPSIISPNGVEMYFVNGKRVPNPKKSVIVEE